MTTAKLCTCDCCVDIAKAYQKAIACMPEVSFPTIVYDYESDPFLAKGAQPGIVIVGYDQGLTMGDVVTFFDIPGVKYNFNVMEPIEVYPIADDWDPRDSYRLRNSHSWPNRKRFKRSQRRRK